MLLSRASKFTGRLDAYFFPRPCSAGSVFLSGFLGFCPRATNQLPSPGLSLDALVDGAARGGTIAKWFLLLG
eukprot:scaffold192560_cov73-Attheya_sp.AAC.1